MLFFFKTVLNPEKFKYFAFFFLYGRCRPSIWLILPNVGELERCQRFAFFCAPLIFRIKSSNSNLFPQYRRPHYRHRRFTDSGFRIFFQIFRRYANAFAIFSIFASAKITTVCHDWDKIRSICDLLNFCGIYLRLRIVDLYATIPPCLHCYIQYC